MCIRDRPWSEAERGFHRIVRGLRLPWSYRTNDKVVVGPRIAYFDLALPELRLAFEVDGSSSRAWELSLIHI